MVAVKFNKIQNKDEESSRRNVNGFTLLEMLIALVILSISILGLTGTILTSMQTNLRNDLRNTAVSLSSQVSSELISTSFDGIADDSETRSVTVRGSTIPYEISWSVTDLSNDTVQIDLSVQYSYRGQDFTNNTVLYKHRAM